MTQREEEPPWTKLTCPMQSTQAAQTWCERAKCAWWDEERESCCIVTLVDELSDMRVLLTLLVDRTTPTEVKGPERADDSAAE